MPFPWDLFLENLQEEISNHFGRARTNTNQDNSLQTFIPLPKNQLAEILIERQQETILLSGKIKNIPVLETGGNFLNPGDPSPLLNHL